MPAPRGPKSADVMAGEPFGKYVLIRRLAMGGMAEVCLARLQGTAGFNKLVVIKQVLPAFAENPQFVEMFLDEGRLAARLSHPNIAQTFELGEVDGRHYLAMEYVPGESLYAVLRKLRERGEALPLSCALRIEMQLLEALEYAHALHDEHGDPLNLVHRDVTPSNVMVTHQGAIKLLDFGIARAATQVHRTEAGRVKGKGGYMAPEQCRSTAVDHRADIYGAGAVLYLMTTGVKPFEHLGPGADLFAQMNATMEGKFLPPHQVKKDIHPELERIILKAMALKPEARFATAGEMLEELEHFVATQGAFPRPRELGDLVKRLFPPRVEAGPFEPSREPSSSRATPHPSPDARLATADPAINEPAAAPGAGDEVALLQGTAPSAPAVSEPLRPPLPIWVLALVGAGLLVLGVALALMVGRTPTGDASKRGATALPAPGSRAAVVGARPAIDGPTGQDAPAEATAVEGAERAAVGGPAAAERAAPATVEDEVTGEAAVPSGTAKGDRERKTKREPVREREVAREKDPVREKGGRLPSARGKATGTVVINSYPWSKVRWNGKELGITPLRSELPPGTHQLELTHPPLSLTKTVTITVKTGEEANHFEKLAP